MNKKNILYIILGSLSLVIAIFLICYFSIPRIDYNYDKEKDCYYVNHAYGNAKTYEILDEVKGKKVTYIDEKAFMDKTKLEALVLGENIKKIERLAFSNCKNLTEINLINIVTIERSAFLGCSKLTSVNLDNCVDLMGGAFYDCYQLLVVNMPKVQSIGSYCFANTILKEVVLPSSLTMIGNEAFYKCNNLVKIKCYSNVLNSNEYLLSLGTLVEFE